MKFVSGLLAAGFAAIAVTSAFGQAETPAHILDRARVAITKGDIAEAEALLSVLAGDTVDQNDVDFLRGTAAIAKRDYDTAITHFRALLARDPTANRVRLDLARAYFLKGDDVAATYYFRAARSQGVPPEVDVNIEKFLDEIRRRKRWDIAVSVAIAPDTNINAATTAQSIDVFGLPFQLDPTARQKSGVGISAALAGSYQFSLADNLRLKTGIEYYDTEYGNPAFTDRNLNILVGPRYLFGQGSEVSVLATGSRRWFGGSPFTYGGGGRIEAQTQLSPNMLLSGVISGQQLTYDAPSYADYTGPILSANTALLYSFDAFSFLRGVVGVVREQAAASALRDTQYQIGGGYYRQNLWKGFAIYGGIAGTLIRYDAALPAFGVARHETEFDYRVSFSNKGIDIFGFTPVVSYLHTDRYSNIDLYSYHRDRGEIGVTRNF